MVGAFRAWSRSRGSRIRCSRSGTRLLRPEQHLPHRRLGQAGGDHRLTDDHPARRHAATTIRKASPSRPTTPSGSPAKATRPTAVPNRLLKLDLDGNVLAEIGLPARDRRLPRGDDRPVPRARTLGSGFEGSTVLRRPGGGATVSRSPSSVAGTTRRPACEALDDDGGGLNAIGEPNWTRIWIYDPQTGATVEPCRLGTCAAAAERGVGRAVGDHRVPEDGCILIERDNLTGDFAVLKTLVKSPRHAGADGLITSGEKSVYDLLRISRHQRLDHRQARRRRGDTDGRTFVPPTTTASTTGPEKPGSSSSVASGGCSGRTLRITGSRGAPRSGPQSRRPHVWSSRNSVPVAA